MTQEKEYFQRAQEFVKKQSEAELKLKELKKRELFIETEEIVFKKKINELEDQAITMETKEKKFRKLTKEFELRDLRLREEDDDIEKREAEYLKKLNTLENHEKSVLSNLKQKKKHLESMEKEIELKQKKLHQKQRNLDKKKISMEYAQNIMETEKSSLIDDEFEQYLHNELNTGNKFDNMNVLSNVNLRAGTGKSIYGLIETCKNLLGNHKLGEAKMYYNQVREKYYVQTFPSKKEKESVHNMIRALYDEINLADLGNG